MPSNIILTFHNLVRWIVVIAGLIALDMAYRGWLRKRSWTWSARRIRAFFVASLDVQLVLGLLLYLWLSPITKQAFADFGAAMGNSEIRFFALGHGLVMLLAVVFARIGTARSKNAIADVDKYRQAAIWFSLAFLLVLLGMPWGRPFFP